MKTRALPCVALLLVLMATPFPATAWDDATGDLDLPWMGNGERARLFTKTSSCMLCPTGSSFHRRWGRSGSSGSDPYDDVDAALRFLQTKGVLGTWPEAIAEGSVGTGSEIIEPRASPHRFTVAMIAPLVVVMRFDLGALVKVGAFDPDQAIGTPRLNQGVEFGTRLPATGTLSWFSPDGKQTPTPVTLTRPDHGAIVVQGIQLDLDRRDDGWTVTRPQRATR